MSFLKKIYSGPLQDASRVQGYSEEEINQIERLHDINIEDDFRDFMLEMGRCSGGLFGDEIIFYRDQYQFPVKRHILAQSGMADDASDALGESIRKFKPVWIAHISETQHFYMLTGDGQDDTVYHYDENYETVKSTGKGVLEFMKEQADYYGSRQGEYICEGELIKF